MTAWLFAIGIVALIGAVAVVAAGRGDALAEVYDDRPDARVPAGPLGPADLRGVRFSTAFRGYRADEVDALLDRLAEQLAEAQERAARDASARPDQPDVP